MMNELQIAKLKGMLNGLPEEILDAIIIEMNKLMVAGFDPQDVFPLGIVIPDTARVRMILGMDKFNEVIEYLENGLDKPIIHDLRTYDVGLGNNFRRIEFNIGERLNRGNLSGGGWSSGG